MKNLLVCSALVLVGCGSSATSFVRSPETTLGRVVVYRNGVAYFERIAHVDGPELRLQVPADKVDDFLKSLTVVDAKTGEPAPVAYPTNVPPSGTGLVDMDIHLQGNAPHALRLSYVTEAPSWKPSYRFVVEKDGKVNVQGWAIVDNTSGEDWKGVRLGVGSSSAMSFRFDLRSVRVVERETLRSNDLFALAPPMGGAAYGNAPPRVVGDLPDAALAYADAAPAPPPIPRGASGGRGGPPAKAPAASAAPAQNGAIVALANSLRDRGERVVIEGYAGASDADKNGASLQRANRVKDELVRNGVDARNVVVVARGEQPGRAGGVRIVEEQTPAQDDKGKLDADGAAAEREGGGGARGRTNARAEGAEEPIGTSHFESTSAMTVPRGTSAMVSILSHETDGEIVYLYDAESARGNAEFPFRAVRLRNPTDSVLESGPVTVFGDGKFIGEGMSEPVPARSVAFVPFALDRQVLVETHGAERDEIEQIRAVQRGVFSAEIRHTRARRLTLHNRSPERATVYVRHTPAQGYTLSRAPGCEVTPNGGGCERIGDAYLFKVDLDANKSADVTIEERTPVVRAMDIRSPADLDLVEVYLTSAAASGPLKEKVGELVKVHAEMTKIEQQIQTTREQMQEYRVRMDELHAQLVTLKAVKTAGPLMATLEKKMADVSERLSKATVDVVGLQEKLMIARVHFQDGVAELSLDARTAEK